MLTASEIQSNIENRFKKEIGQSVAQGSVLDMFNVAVSEAVEGLYQEIEDAKNPHLWSKLQGEQLDDMGTMLNIPREVDESDSTYKYRIMNWVLTNEKGNLTAINDSLLNAQYASNIEFHPYTKGSGTGTCYVIPNDYSDETVAKAFEEAEEKIKKIASPGLHVEYVIPTALPVKLQIFISSNSGDMNLLKSNIQDQIKQYINKIPPGEYLEAGKLNKIGIETPQVDYFNVMAIIIDGKTISSIKKVQELESKFLFDEIIWAEE